MSSPLLESQENVAILVKEGRFSDNFNQFHNYIVNFNKAKSVGTGKNKIFISCGQRTPDEKALGQEIQALVRELTPFEPYFAEYQTTLDGLTKNIFNELYGAIGFITVMHRRQH